MLERRCRADSVTHVETTGAERWPSDRAAYVILFAIATKPLRYAGPILLPASGRLRPDRGRVYLSRDTWAAGEAVLSPNVNRYTDSSSASVEVRAHVAFDPN